MTRPQLLISESFYPFSSLAIVLHGSLLSLIVQCTFSQKQARRKKNPKQTQTQKIHCLENQFYQNEMQFIWTDQTKAQIQHAPIPPSRLLTSLHNTQLHNATTITSLDFQK